MPDPTIASTNESCSGGNHQGRGPFCTLCGQRVLANSQVFSTKKMSLWKKLLIGLGGTVGVLVLIAVIASPSPTPGPEEEANASVTRMASEESKPETTTLVYEPRETPTESLSLIVEAPGMPIMIIKPTFVLYADTKSLLDNSDSQRTNNRYKVSTSTYNQIQNLALPRNEENIAKVAHWKKQFDIHWPNVDAFQVSMDSIMQDRIIDKEESTSICFALDQWTTQMTDAITYVQDYRKVDPQTVEKNPGLGNLEHEANRALELLNQVECE